MMAGVRSLSAVLVAQIGSVQAVALDGETCVASGADGNCDARAVEGMQPVARDHHLLQIGGHASVDEQGRHRRAPGFSSDLQEGIECFGLSHVDRTCSSNGCKVLASGMRDRTCRQYCQANGGLSCKGAWEDHNDECNAKAELTCDQTWPHTHDLICECAPGPARSTDVRDLKLIWSDDFDGSSVSEDKWSIVRAGGGFGNHELQYYTDHDSNVHVGHGVLRITAKCENYHGHAFTSAKIETKHKADWGPGHRVEVRARMPKGKGTWPAIWMLPVENAYGGWPHSGEIDIMESVGCTRGKIYGTVHTGAFNHMKHTEKSTAFKTELGDWHTYAIEWTDSDLSWFIDGKLYHRFAKHSGNSEEWPLDRRFFLILNLAVGGDWGGYCVHGRPSCHSDDQFGHEQVMEVDYARVYAL